MLTQMQVDKGASLTACTSDYPPGTRTAGVANLSCAQLDTATLEHLPLGVRVWRCYVTVFGGGTMLMPDVSTGWKSRH